MNFKIFCEVGKKIKHRRVGNVCRLTRCPFVVLFLCPVFPVKMVYFYSVFLFVTFCRVVVFYACTQLLYKFNFLTLIHPFPLALCYFLFRYFFIITPNSRRTSECLSRCQSFNEFKSSSTGSAVFPGSITLFFRKKLRSSIC